jgi:uncharacterized protein (DUF934 family)
MSLYDVNGPFKDAWADGRIDDLNGNAGAAVLVTLETLHADDGSLFAGNRIVGVEVNGEIEPDQLADHLTRLSLIIIRFPVFKDGRGFTLARLLRERYGFSGELRAAGDILPDQLQFLLRVGFSTFEFPDTVAPDHIQNALNRFSVWFQAAADSRSPAQALRRPQHKDAAE